MSQQRLEQRAEQLEQQGASPLRIDLLRRSQRFKRSWIDMAEALSQLRKSRAYEQWGYNDIYAYCSEELLLKSRTVDKLTGSYSTVQRHAPQMLEPADEQPSVIPSYDSVDYFAKALGERAGDQPRNPPPDRVDELHQAVFDEGAGVTSLRRRFNPVFFSKTDEQNALDLLQRTNANVQRLVQTLPEIGGLSNQRIALAAAALSELQEDLERLIPEAQARVERSAAA